MLNALRGVGLRRAAAVAFVLVVTVSGASVGSAADAGAANATTLQVAASADRVTVSETTTVEVRVSDVDGGVGAYELAVGLSDPSVASIADVELVGDPGLRTVSVADDGSRADLKAALLDTADAGDVTVARVTLSGVAPGTTDVSVSVSALGAEDGSAYAVDGRSASVTVAESTPTPAPTPAPTDGAAPDASDGGSAPAATDAPSVTAVDEDAGASTPDAEAGAAESVANRTPVPFVPEGVPGWLVGAALVALAVALLVARRRR